MFAYERGFHSSRRKEIGEVGRRTLQLECEVIGQVSAFVVSSKEEQGVWIPDLKRPEIKYALQDRVQLRMASVEEMKDGDRPQC
jgi:hypothetical protein